MARRADLEDHTRHILAGLEQEGEDLGELEGRPALFVVNLEVKRMMGELSAGMLFDIGYPDGDPIGASRAGAVRAKRVEGGLDLGRPLVNVGWQSSSAHPRRDTLRLPAALR